MAHQGFVWAHFRSTEVDGTQEYGFLFSNSTSSRVVNREEEPVLPHHGKLLCHPVAAKSSEGPFSLGRALHPTHLAAGMSRYVNTIAATVYAARPNTISGRLYGKANRPVDSGSRIRLRGE